MKTIFGENDTLGVRLNMKASIRKNFCPVQDKKLDIVILPRSPYVLAKK